MRAGNLRIKAEIQSIGTTQNAFGEIELGGFTKFKDVYCSITPLNLLRANEAFLSNADFSKTTHSIKIRYTDGVNASQRLVWGSRVFNFISIRNISELNKEIEILAEEVVNVD